MSIIPQSLESFAGSSRLLTNEGTRERHAAEPLILLPLGTVQSIASTLFTFKLIGSTPTISYLYRIIVTPTESHRSVFLVETTSVAGDHFAREP